MWTFKIPYPNFSKNIDSTLYAGPNYSISTKSCVWSSGVQFQLLLIFPKGGSKASLLIMTGVNPLPTEENSELTNFPYDLRVLYNGKPLDPP